MDIGKTRRRGSARRLPGYGGHRSYDNDVTGGFDGPPDIAIPDVASDERPPTRRIDIDPRSAIPICIAFAILAVGIWFVRQIPRTLSLLVIASLLAFALMPVVEALKRRTGWKRRYVAAIVLVGTGVIAITTIVLVAVPTIDQVRQFNKDIPKTVKQMGELPLIGPRLREADASKKVKDWLDNLPERLDVDSTPIADAAGTIADGIAATLFALLLAITLLLDGERLVRMGRSLIPPRRRPDADRFARLVYDVIGRYIAGTLFVAALAGVVVLVASLSLGVPLAPLLAVWVALCNPMPQIGGFLGAVPFVALGLTQSAVKGVTCLIIFLVYQQIENHVLQPLIIGRAVQLTPPATMVAALIGVAAGGVIGGMLAIPLLGASKAIYMALRSPELEVVPPGWTPPADALPPSPPLLS
jgi:predicted PurR-regulated permease PerM